MNVRAPCDVQSLDGRHTRETMPFKNVDFRRAPSRSRKQTVS